MTYLLQPRYTEDKLSGNSIQKARGGPLGGYFFLPPPVTYPSEDGSHLLGEGFLIPENRFRGPIRIKGRKESDMPDIFDNGLIPFVSNKARQIINDLDFQASIFTEIQFIGIKKVLHPPYFYWHVDSFRQTFDFEASQAKKLTSGEIFNFLTKQYARGITIVGEAPRPGQDGIIFDVSLGSGLEGGAVRWRVKADTPGRPRFWRETDLMRDGALYTGLRRHIFMSDHAFDVLDKAFPGQLLSERVAVSIQ